MITPHQSQFLIRVVGDLREEIAGTKVAKSQALEIREEFIAADAERAISAWITALRAILPIIVQGLPGEEYQVVRSTELTNAVSERAKGIVAGASILQESFQDLRKLLRPV